MGSDWLWLLQAPNYVWYSRYPPATDEEVERLASYFGRPLPPDYDTFLRTCSGGELSNDDLWTIHLWPIGEIPRWSEAYGFVPDRMANAVAFGDNGGGETLVFDTRPEHPDGQYPVVAVNLVSIGWDEVILVAESFRDLMLLRHPLLQ
jgi:hypothetical protein